MHQGAGNGNTLLLTTAEPVWIGLKPIRQPHPLEQCHRLAPPIAAVSRSKVRTLRQGLVRRIGPR